MATKAAKKKKPVITKRDLKAAAKESRRILQAMVAADFPEEGVVVDGWRYRPLDFGPAWRTACEKRQQKATAAMIAAFKAWRAKKEPQFKLGDKVYCRIYPDGGVGTIVRVPKKRGQSNSVLFPGIYAYDVDFEGRGKRLAEVHLELVKATAR